MSALGQKQTYAVQYVMSASHRTVLTDTATTNTAYYPDQVSAAQTDDDEGIEQVEANSWNNEQIHGGNIRRVVAQKRAPSLTGG